MQLMWWGPSAGQPWAGFEMVGSAHVSDGRCQRKAVSEKSCVPNESGALARIGPHGRKSAAFPGSSSTRSEPVGWWAPDSEKSSAALLRWIARTSELNLRTRMCTGLRTTLSHRTGR